MEPGDRMHLSSLMLAFRKRCMHVAAASLGMTNPWLAMQLPGFCERRTSFELFNTCYVIVPCSVIVSGLDYEVELPLLKKQKQEAESNPVTIASVVAPPQVTKYFAKLQIVCIHKFGVLMHTFTDLHQTVMLHPRMPFFAVRITRYCHKMSLRARLHTFHVNALPMIEGLLSTLHYSVVFQGAVLR